MDELEKIIFPIEPRPRAPLTPDDLDNRAARIKCWQRYTISRARAIENRQLELCQHRDNALAELKKLDRKVHMDSRFSRSRSSNGPRL